MKLMRDCRLWRRWGLRSRTYDYKPEKKMHRNGKALESIVAIVERTFDGAHVEVREKAFDEDGNQVAEFDIVISGKFGSTDLRWLIECRDRPSEGAAPAQWIEQLVGRRSRFNFNKVTAVSTTGFAPGAVSYADDEGIELRVVESLSPSQLSKWLHISEISSVTRDIVLRSAHVELDAQEPPAHVDAVALLLATHTDDRPLLRSCKTNVQCRFSDAFVSALHQLEDALSSRFVVEENQSIKFIANYTAEDHYVVETHAGTIPIRRIHFEGSVRVKSVEKAVLTGAKVYRESTTKRDISQVAVFDATAIESLGNSYLEFHKIVESGKTQVVLRKVS
jgi:hypothetical protein